MSEIYQIPMHTITANITTHLRYASWVLTREYVASHVVVVDICCA